MDEDGAAFPLDIERLTYGPDALAHRQGQVVFVPYAAPGDRVRARVTARRRDYLRAEIASIERAGATRVAPRCPVFGRCGGCQWQHVDGAAQRAAKTAIVAEQLARLGGIADAPVRPALGAAPWAYRARITLVAEGRRLGFHRARSHHLEPILGCPIADPVVEAHLTVARAWTARLRSAARRVTIAVAPGGVALVAALGGPPSPVDVAETEALLVEEGSVRGAVLQGGGQRAVVGDPTVRHDLEPGLALEAPADVFAQVNPEANRLLVRTVVALAEFAPGGQVLDLYCGAGNLGLPLARRGFPITGVEQSPVAVDAARRNAVRLGLDAARFVAGEVATTLAAWEGSAPCGVVLDPPRAGAAAALPALVALRPPRIVYVSCDPATLARDVSALAAHGYALRAVQPLDLFPQTYHVETVALLGLT